MSTVVEENEVVKSDSKNSDFRGMCGKQKSRLPVVKISAKDDLICSFNFIVTLNQYTFGFASVSGISMEREVNFIQEGGVNDHQLMVGCPQGSGGYKLEFSRGLMLHAPASPYNIANAIAAASIGNSIARKAALLALSGADPQQTLEKGPALGTIQIYDRQNKLKAMYSFLSLGMTSWSGGDLSAGDTGILIENISIVHTGLIRVPLTPNKIPYVGAKPDYKTQALREQFLKKAREKLSKLIDEKEAKRKVFLEELEKRKQRIEKIKEEIQKKIEEEAKKRKEKQEENSRKSKEIEKKNQEKAAKEAEKREERQEKNSKEIEKKNQEKAEKEAEKRKELDKKRNEKREKERKLSEEREKKQKEENKKKIEESKQKAQENKDKIEKKAEEDKEKREKTIEESNKKREQKAKEVAKEREERSEKIANKNQERAQAEKDRRNLK